MKKKMIALVVLVFAVAITSYSVSGTYAKYTTTGQITNKARVAKWGINLSTFNQTKIDLFKDSYNKNAIKSSGGTEDLVIAPGASGYYHFDLSVTGTPEVAYDLVVAATVTDNTTNGLKFLLKQEGSATTEGFDYSSQCTQDKTAFETALKNLSGDASGTKHYNANEAPFGGNNGYTIYWTWPFDNVNDTNDTTDGNNTDLTNAGSTGAEIILSITATQAKTAPSP